MIDRRTITDAAERALAKDWPCASCQHAASEHGHICARCRWAPDRQDMYDPRIRRPNASNERRQEPPERTP